MNTRARLPILAAAFTAPFFAAAASAQLRVEHRFPVGENPVVTVQNSSGRIEVKAWDRNEVLVVAQRASASVEVATEKAGNRIEVATRLVRNRPSADSIKTDYEISVPAETELQVRTDSGNVIVARVHGDMTFDTVAADLALSDVQGYVIIKSIGGSLLCTRCAGRLDATSISGNVQLLQPLMENVRVQTSSGNILFDGEFLSRGIYVLKNYSGTIEVRFSNSDSFDVRATSLYGEVLNEAPVVADRHNMPAPRGRMVRSLFGTMNEGHAKVELSSFSGTIKIIKRN